MSISIWSPHNTDLSSKQESIQKKFTTKLHGRANINGRGQEGILSDVIELFLAWYSCTTLVFLNPSGVIIIPREPLKGGH